jgi:hypothetical protein
VKDVKALAFGYLMNLTRLPESNAAITASYSLTMQRQLELSKSWSTEVTTRINQTRSKKMKTVDLMEFAAALKEANPDACPAAVANTASEIIKWANVIERYNTDACNREVSKRETAKMDRAVSKIMDAAKLYCEPGVMVINSDPRGYAIRLLLKSKRTNDMQHEGFYVPTK